MKNIDRWFVLTGLVFLLIGMTLGIKMVKTMDFTMHGLHAHLNLLGFVVMTLYGLCYRQWPRMQEGVLATVHYLLHTVSVATALGLLYVIMSDADMAPKVGPVQHASLFVILAATLLFAYLFFTRAKE